MKRRARLWYLSWRQLFHNFRGTGRLEILGRGATLRCPIELSQLIKSKFTKDGAIDTPPSQLHS